MNSDLDNYIASLERDLNLAKEGFLFSTNAEDCKRKRDHRKRHEWDGGCLRTIKEELISKGYEFRVEKPAYNMGRNTIIPEFVAIYIKPKN